MVSSAGCNSVSTTGRLHPYTPETEHIKLGAHHTLELDLQRAVQIEKEVSRCGGRNLDISLNISLNISFHIIDVNDPDILTSA